MLPRELHTFNLNKPGAVSEKKLIAASRLGIDLSFAEVQLVQLKATKPEQVLSKTILERSRPLRSFLAELFAVDKIPQNAYNPYIGAGCLILSGVAAYLTSAISGGNENLISYGNVLLGGGSAMVAMSPAILRSKKMRGILFNP